MRIQKWLYFTKHFIYSPQSWLAGFGPGVTGAALDGSILRIILEGGIIGSILYFVFFRSIYKLNTTMKLMVVNYVINMIFFDAHLSYKTMSILLFAAGYYYATQNSPESTQLQCAEG